MLALIKGNEIVDTVHEGDGFEVVVTYEVDIDVEGEPDADGHPTKRIETVERTGTSYTRPAHDGWSGNGYSLREIVEGQPAPDGKEIAGRTLKLIAGVPTYVHTFSDVPIETLRVALRAEVSAKLATILASGFRYDFGGSIGAKVLQTRDADDRINWLTSQAAYSAAVAQGAGDVQGAEFRTSDNTDVTVTFQTGLVILLEMAAWGRACYQASWSLKNQIDAASSYQALSAIDLEAGWPS